MSDNTPQPFNPGSVERPHIAALLDRLGERDGKHADRSFAAAMRRLGLGLAKVDGVRRP